MAMKVAYIIPDSNLLMTQPIPGASAATVRQYVLRVQDMPSEDKPREKMLKSGPNALTTNELLAIVLGTGTTKEGVMEMTSRVMKEYGDRAIIGRANAKELSETMDIPLVKAMQIVAVGELGRRFFEKKDGPLTTIRTAQDVFEYTKDMRDLPKEHLRGIYLNTHHRIVHDETISIGTINTSITHPREVFKPGIEYGAVAVILVHNHPSGVVTPSEADIEITKQLVTAGKIVGIHLIDHVIVGKDSFASVSVDYN